MKHILLLLMLSSASLFSIAAVVPTFTMTHTVNDENLVLPFPSGESEKYYTNAAIAVVIDEIYVDGVPVTALSYKGQIRLDVDTRTHEPVLPSRMVYRLHHQQLVTARSRDKKGQLEFQQYEFPRDAAKIEISYRIRYANARISGEMRLVSLGYSEMIRTDTKPADRSP